MASSARSRHHRYFAMAEAEHARENPQGIALGDILGQRYRVLRARDWPGPGWWFEGRDELLDRIVTLQCLPATGISQQNLNRCRQDAHRASDLYDTVLTVDWLTLVTTGELVGEPLSVRREREGKLDAQWVESMVSDVARRLAHAHELDVVHGCLTSDQVICANRDTSDLARAWLSGFGLRWLLAENAREARAIDDIRALAEIATQCLTDAIEPGSGAQRDLESVVRRMVNQAYAAASPGSRPLLEEAWSGFRFRAAPARSVAPALSAAPSPVVATATPAKRIDEEVQISVYRPKLIAPARWYKLLAYAHLAAKRPDDPADDPDPVQEVQRRALAALGEASKDYRSTSQETLQGLPEGGHITFVPEVKGIEFNPPSRSFAWLESIHEETFSLRAAAAPDGTVLRGTLSAYLGPILLADVPLSFKVERKAGDTTSERELSRARAYRKVFASYSRRDTAVVHHFDEVMATLGERYLIDVRDIRSGELWSPRLEELIREADVFQLFWSSSSMRSAFCRAEWEYALALNRERFVRPVFWESPMPRDDGVGLPPEELERIGFASFGQRPPPAADLEAAKSVSEGPAHEAAPPRDISARRGDGSPRTQSRSARMSEPPRAARARRFAAAVSLAVFTLIIGATALVTTEGPAPLGLPTPARPDPGSISSAAPPTPGVEVAGPSHPVGAATSPPIRATASPRIRPTGRPPTGIPKPPPTPAVTRTKLSRQLDAARAAQQRLEARLVTTQEPAERARLQREIEKAREQTEQARRQLDAADAQHIGPQLGF
jgi:hypothetical protein